jgi:hypothetical protein
VKFGFRSLPLEGGENFSIGHLLAIYWPFIGHLLAIYWPFIGQILTGAALAVLPVIATYVAIIETHVVTSSVLQGALNMAANSEALSAI